MLPSVVLRQRGALSRNIMESTGSSHQSWLAYVYILFQVIEGEMPM